MLGIKFDKVRYETSIKIVRIIHIIGLIWGI